MYVGKRGTQNGFGIDVFIQGISSTALIVAWLIFAVIFALAYWALSADPAQGITPLDEVTPLGRFLEALYYSVIIGTTSGLGDIEPHGLSRAITAFQATFSFILLAAFVAKFATRKQEKVLNDIHELSFDTSFHTIRNGLFIARKDIDVIIKKILADTNMEDKDWSNLKTALRQMQIFIKHIPDFYRKTTKTHDFDTDREMLLIDSLGRTLTRLIEALALFRERGITVAKSGPVHKELRSLMSQIESMSLHEEQKTLDPENHEGFQEVLNRVEEVKSYF